MFDYVLEFWQDGLNNIKIKDFMLYILISNAEKLNFILVSVTVLLCDSRQEVRLILPLILTDFLPSLCFTSLAENYR